MNGSSRFVVTITDGKKYACILFTKETASRLYKACRAFAFDARVHYRVNLPKFRNRVSRLYQQYRDNEGLGRLCNLFSEIPDKYYFAVTSGDITGSQLFLQVNSNLDMRNGRKVVPEREEKFRLLSNYDFNAFGKIVRKAGTVTKTKRKCRYCGVGIPFTTFDSKAHTISEALGNKTLYTNDECDFCNTRFGKKIEFQFINRLSPSFPVLNIAGKNGSRKVKGKYYSLYRDEHFHKQIRLHISDAAVLRQGGSHISDIEIRTVSPARTWTPQNIYRFLCKFVIGTLDSRLLRYFRNTVEWINGRNFRAPLPRVCVEHLGHTITQPLIYIYRRQSKEDLHPYMFARVHILNCAYTFIMPYCSLDVEGLNHDSFLKKATGLIPSLRRQWLDLNSSKPIVPEMRINFLSGDHTITRDIDENPHSRWDTLTEPTAHTR